MPLTLAPTISFGGNELATAWQQALLECKVELELRASGQVTLRFADPGYVLTKVKRQLPSAIAVTVDVAPGRNAHRRRSNLLRRRAARGRAAGVGHSGA